jgi:hypothetical protein
MIKETLDVFVSSPMTVNMSVNRHITGGFKQESGVHAVSICSFFSLSSYHHRANPRNRFLEQEETRSSKRNQY